MAKRARNVLLLAKIETVIGTDSVPTAPLNAMHAKVTSIQPTATQFAERGNVRSYFGSGGQVQVACHSEIDIEIELAAAGAAGTAPAYAPLLKACGMAETLTASTNAIYRPETDSTDTVTLYFYLDGLLHKMVGARGNCSFEMNSSAIPMMKFHLLGLYVTAADAAMPSTADYAAFKTPLAINKINTPTWSIHSTTGAMQSLSVDLGNQVVYRNLIGYEGVVLTDRKVTGQASLEMVSVATKAWHEAVRLGTLAPLTITHGSVAGAIIQIDGPKVQLTNPQYSESDGVQMLGVGLDFQPSSGDDEFVLTVK